VHGEPGDPILSLDRCAYARGADIVEMWQNRRK